MVESVKDNDVMGKIAAKRESLEESEGFTTEETDEEIFRAEHSWDHEQRNRYDIECPACAEP